LADLFPATGDPVGLRPLRVAAEPPQVNGPKETDLK